MSIFEKNRGTKLDPYEIWTEDDLRELIDYDDIGNPDLAIEFKSDIEMERDWTSSISGSSSLSFKGLIDGNGFTIRNLNSSNGSPLIYYIEEGTVKNLTLSSVKFDTGNSNVSPFLGQTYLYYSSSNRFSHIINCGVEDAEINLTSTSAGGVGAILGWAQGTSVNVSNSYVKNIRITRGTSNRRGSGAIVGYIQDRTVNLDNVFAFGEVRIYNSTHTRDDYQSTISAVSNRGTINGHVIQATTYSTHNSARRTQTPLVKDSYPSVVSFGQKQGWDMVDGELPFLTYIGTRMNPRKISVKEDLSLIDEFTYDYFELVNDIEVNTRYSSYVFENNFYGTIDGNGYGLYGIDIYNMNPTTYLALFHEFYGYMKDIIIDIEGVYAGTNSGRASALAYTFYGKIRNVRVSVGTLRGGNTNNGLIGNIREGADVKNCFLYVGTLDISNVWNVDILGALSNGSSYNRYDITIENNIFHINNTLASNTRLVESTNENIKNNVLYVGSGSVSLNTGQQTRVNDLNDFRNPDNSAYDSFDKDKWVFRDDEDPIQSVFYVVLEKIEERLISLYSKGISLKTRMSKGFKDIIKFFSKKSESDVTTRRVGNKLKINYSETISSKSSRSGKKLRDIKNYTGRALSNFKKSLSVNKRVEFYTEDILSKINNIKKAMKSSINKMNKINFNSYYVVIKKYFIGVMTYSKEIVTESSWTKLTRMIKTATSYTGGVRSLIWRFTNVYEFVVKWTSSYSSPISSSIVKYAVIKRLSRTYTESISSHSRRFVKRSASALKYARVNVRYNNIKMRVKESMTKIRAFNGGGD